MNWSKLGQVEDAKLVCGIEYRSLASSEGSPFRTVNGVFIYVKHDDVYARLELSEVERSCGISRCTDVESKKMFGGVERNMMTMTNGCITLKARRYCHVRHC